MKTKHVLLVVGLLLVGFALLYSGSHEPSAEPAEQSTPFGISPDTLPLESSLVVPLLVEGASEPVVWQSRTPAAVRAQTIEPDSSLLTAIPSLKEGDRIQLALFDDAVVEGLLSDVTVYPNGSVGMIGQLDGGFKGVLYLSYMDGEMLAHADVYGGNDYYARYDPDLKAHVAIEVDRGKSDYAGECETCLVGRENEHVAGIGVDQIKQKYAVEQVPVELDLFDDPPDSVIVDVMIVYTPAAESWASTNGGINNIIVLAMQKANTAHGNSNTKLSMNLVHSAETAYTESGSASTDLNALRDEGDGFMDDVHALRNTYEADMVCLLEDEPGTGGIGSLMDDADGEPHRAFCLARVQQSSWSYTVVHEWGHNMGCGHSKTQTLSAGPGVIYSYSAGWQWNDTEADENWPYTQIGYCSVMTYENFDNTGDQEYERVPHFSNPDIDFVGDSSNASGDATNGDNALAIRNVRHVVSEFRFPVSKITAYPSTNDFEIGFSPWTYYTDELDWVLNSGSTPSSSTGPSSAYEGSRYGHIEGSSNYPNKTAVLWAGVDFSGVVDPQIDYAYHMYSADTGMGTLYFEASTNAGSSWATLWSMSGNQGPTWFTNRVDLSAYEGESNVELRFRGVTGSNFTSDMALDSVVVSGTASLDVDSDGIPNDWETLYFGGPTNALATANPDFDTYNNIQEYIAGLNPTNSDGFGPSNFMVGANNAFEWYAASGRVYSVYWSSNLLDGFSILQSNLTSGAYTDSTHSAEAQGFYRLEVEVAP